MRTLGTRRSEFRRVFSISRRNVFLTILTSSACSRHDASIINTFERHPSSRQQARIAPAPILTFTNPYHLRNFCSVIHPRTPLHAARKDNNVITQLPCTSCQLMTVVETIYMSYKTGSICIRRNVGTRGRPSPSRHSPLPISKLDRTRRIIRNKADVTF